jgi:hypothetical protein
VFFLVEYPPNHFGGKEAAPFVSEYLSKRYELRHALLEPGGPGTGGTMMRPLIAYGVLLDLQELIILTVRMALTFAEADTGIKIEDWIQRFRSATASYPC